MSALVASVDTSIWILYTRGDPEVVHRLTRLLNADRVYLHPWVRYELLLGAGLPEPLQELLALLPVPDLPDEVEVVRSIAVHQLQRTGIGWVDANLLVSAKSSGMALWTADAKLAKAAQKAKLSKLRGT